MYIKGLTYIMSRFLRNKLDKNNYFINLFGIVKNSF